MMIKNKNILIGITGGIAAYKICELIRMFKREEANVKVITTKNALNFVTKVTLQSLSQNDVATEQFEIEDFKPEHISLADWADILVIAPLSANTLSKFATGICDNLLTSVACAFKKPILIAPAMNDGMWSNKTIQENYKKLLKNGIYSIEPEDGFLACGANGKGRLCNLEKIFSKTDKILDEKKNSINKKIVITAGGTKEKLDTVRYISNYSSGKMGIALADEAFKRGFDVTLISTVTTSKDYNVINVQSALDMQKSVEKEFSNADCLIIAAAVADYRAKEISNTKLKKTKSDEISISLVKNPDILKEICKNKKKNQIVVGFCAESENLLNNAKEKIQNKGCDLLIANDISRKDIGFSSNYNEIYILDKNGNSTKIDKKTKANIAKK